MIEKIYSRKRLNLSKNIQKTSNYNKKIKIRLELICIYIFAFIVVLFCIKGISPIFNKMAEERARGISTEIINSETTKVLDNIEYEDLVKTDKDDNGNLQMLRVNVIEVNNLASSMAYNLQKILNEKTVDKISIPLGSMTGIKYFAGMGPKINIKINPIGSVETNIISVFESAGINQTIHRIYLEVKCKQNVVTPYDILETEIKNQVLIGEAIVVGNIPQTYLNMTKENIE